jgi:hypothetical protein
MYRWKKGQMTKSFIWTRKFKQRNSICLVVFKFLTICCGWFLDILVASYTLVVEHVNLFEHFGANGPHIPSLLL